MNKGDLVSKVAEHTGLSKSQAQDAVNATLQCIQDALNKDGDKVTLIGFGTFAVSHRAEREGRNPATGKSMTIAAKNVVKFKPGSGLSDSVNA